MAKIKRFAAGIATLSLLGLCSMAAAQPAGTYRLISFGETDALFVSEQPSLKGNKAAYSTISVFEPTRIAVDGGPPIRFVEAEWDADCDARTLSIASSKTYKDDHSEAYRTTSAVVAALDVYNSAAFEYACSGELPALVARAKPADAQSAIDLAISGLKRRHGQPAD